MMEEIYSRQREDIYIPSSVTIIGLGGIGSWMALDMAMIGVKTLYLHDPDVVEESNLSRTPYKVLHIGVKKVEAARDLILERRPTTDVYTFSNEVRTFADLSSSEKSGNLRIDCRDNVEDLGGIIHLALGYDGEGITLHQWPDYDSVIGTTGGGYEQDTYVAVPQLLAALATYWVCRIYPIRQIGDERHMTLNLKDIFKERGLI